MCLLQQCCSNIQRQIHRMAFVNFELSHSPSVEWDQVPCMLPGNIPKPRLRRRHRHVCSTLECISHWNFLAAFVTPDKHTKQLHVNRECQQQKLVTVCQAIQILRFAEGKHQARNMMPDCQHSNHSSNGNLKELAYHPNLHKSQLRTACTTDHWWMREWATWICVLHLPAEEPQKRTIKLRLSEKQARNHRNQARITHLHILGSCAHEQRPLDQISCRIAHDQLGYGSACHSQISKSTTARHIFHCYSTRHTG